MARCTVDKAGSPDIICRKKKKKQLEKDEEENRVGEEDI